MKKILIGSLVGLSIVLMGVGIYLNRVFLSDWFKAMSYQETPEMLEIENNLYLTKAGSLIFRASNPELETETEFNQNCDSEKVEISVLGCYASGSIHVYDIDYKDLNGIVESTMAHELLHAVWRRLEKGDQEKIGQLLMSVYNNNKYHDLLEGDLENYNDSEILDELHSRVGTEIKNLPADLEEHYAKYFKDQDKVVKYYDDYSGVFNALKKEREELDSELKRLKAEIDALNAEYVSFSADLMERINTFNNCASTSGCFETEREFNLQRNQLLVEKEELNEQYKRINGLVSEYNVLVEKYNNNILRNKELESIINSNVNSSEIIK